MVSLTGKPSEFTLAGLFSFSDGGSLMNTVTLLGIDIGKHSFSEPREGPQDSAGRSGLCHNQCRVWRDLCILELSAVDVGRHSI